MRFSVVLLLAALCGFSAFGFGQSPSTAVRITLTEPKLDGNKNKLEVASKAEFIVTIRISNVTKEVRPDVTFARFLRGPAMAGEFIARPRPVSENEVEYSTKVIAPKNSGRYKLIVAPSPFSESIHGAPDKKLYPNIDIIVK